MPHSLPPTQPVSPPAPRPAAGERLLPWLILAGALLAARAMFGAWVPHKAAGLVIPGLDLAEYVKFLPQVAHGQITLVREAFYAPLVAASLAHAFLAFRLELASRPLQALARLIVVLLAMVIALNLLPPAWSPPLLLTPEFRLQIGVMVILLGLALASPLLALLPRRAAAAFLAMSATLAAMAPLPPLQRVWPAIEGLYGHTLQPGWGLWVTLAGLLLMAGTAVAWGLRRPA